MWIPPLLIVAIFCPESPWWLVRRGRAQEARKSLERLMIRDYEQLAASYGVPDYSIDNVVSMMQATHDAEVTVRSGSSYIECFRGSNLHRTEIVCVGWMCQVLSGIVFFSVLSYFLQQAGLASDSSFNFSLGNYALNIVGTMVAWVLAALGIGRRQMYLVGLSSLVCILVTTGAVSTIGNSASSWAVAGLLMCWTLVYQCTIGTICFALVAEVPARKLLVKTINLGRITYSASFIVANSINPYMISPNSWNWGGKAAFFWAGTCLLSLLWAFFRLPEVQGLTFLEIDKMFESRVSALQSTKYVADALNNPESTANAFKHHENQ